MSEPSQPSQQGTQVFRVLIFGSGTALYLFFCNWSYSAAVGGDVTTAAVAIFLAWLVGVCALALSEQFGAVSKRQKLSLNVSFAVALGVISAGLFGYFYQHRPKPPPDLSLIEIDPSDPERLKDGTYYMPVTLTDGGSPIEGYYTVFEQQLFSTKLDRAGEDFFMGYLETQIENLHLTPAQVQTVGNRLTSDHEFKLRETELKLTEDQFQQTQTGKSFLYYGVIVVYSDQTAKDNNILYIAERCMYYDGNIGDFISCDGHNFPRNIFH